jgi:hypothetical protein
MEYAAWKLLNTLLQGNNITITYRKDSLFAAAGKGDFIAFGLLVIPVSVCIKLYQNETETNYAPPLCIVLLIF